MQNFFYTFIISLFLTGTLFSMEASKLDIQTQKIEQKYVEKASSLLNQHMAALSELSTRDRYLYERLLEESQEAISTLRAMLDTSPESFF